MFIKYYQIIFICAISFSLSKIFPIINEEIEKYGTGNITSINIRSYEEYINIINNNDIVISLFHVNWCGHCKKFKPILDKASSYNSLNKKWKFLKIDCSIYPYICSIFNIQMYPTITIYKSQKIYYSEPPRELFPLLQFLYKISDNPLINISSKEIFLKKYGENSPLIEYNKNEPDFFQCIKNLSNDVFLEDLYFGVFESNNNEQKIIFDYSMINLPNISYEWDKNCVNARNFIYENKYPLLNEIDSNFLKEIVKESKIIIFFVLFMKNKKINNFIFSDLMNLSYYNRKFIFGYSDYNNDKYISQFFKFHLENFNEMKLIIYDFRKRMQYIHNKIFNIENHSTKEIIKEMQNLIDNIENLDFSSGSKFQDLFFNYINFNEMSPLKQAIVSGVFVLILIIIIYVLFHFSGPSGNDNEEDSDEDFDEFIKNMEEKESSNNNINNKSEDKNQKNNSDKQKIE